MWHTYVTHLRWCHPVCGLPDRCYTSKMMSHCLWPSRSLRPVCSIIWLFVTRVFPGLGHFCLSLPTPRTPGNFPGPAPCDCGLNCLFVTKNKSIGKKSLGLVGVQVWALCLSNKLKKEMGKSGAFFFLSLADDHSYLAPITLAPCPSSPSIPSPSPSTLVYHSRHGWMKERKKQSMCS